MTSFCQVTTSIYNLILGKLYCDHYGTMRVQGTSNYSCKLKFKEQSIIERNPHQVTLSLSLSLSCACMHSSILLQQNQSLGFLVFFKILLPPFLAPYIFFMHILPEKSGIEVTNHFVPNMIRIIWCILHMIQ